MKQYRFLALFLLPLLTTNGCVQTTEPLVSRNFVALANWGLAFTIDSSAYNAIAHSQYDAFLQCSGTKIISLGSFDTTVTIAGVFANDQFIVYPDSVSINNQYLGRKSSESSFLLYDKKILSASSLNWNVQNYENGTFTDSLKSLSFPDISIKDHIDTVSKATGFTINFQCNNVAILSAAAKFDYGLTSYYKDSASSHNATGYISKPLTNVSSVTFMANDLASFTPERYIMVWITNYEYHIKPSSTGRKVGVFSSRTTAVAFYLKS